MAISEIWTETGDHPPELAMWWRVSVIDMAAVACNEYLKKGWKVLVEGRMNADPKTGNPRNFQRHDGCSGTSFEVTAAQVKFLSSPGEGRRTTTTPKKISTSSLLALRQPRE